MDRHGEPLGTQRRREKFHYDMMKSAATSDDDASRKQAFIEYFERFAEFPSYLFDNESGIDARLQKTIDDIRNDVYTEAHVRTGIEALVERLSE